MNGKNCLHEKVGVGIPVHKAGAYDPVTVGPPRLECLICGKPVYLWIEPGNVQAVELEESRNVAAEEWK